MLSFSINNFFFFNDTATTEIYTLSLHDALPIWWRPPRRGPPSSCWARGGHERHAAGAAGAPPQGAEASDLPRSEEHTSELQSRQYLECGLLLEKKNIQQRDDNAVDHCDIALHIR